MPTAAMGRLTEMPFHLIISVSSHLINIETLTIRWLEMAATGDCQFASMNWPRRREVAGIKMERVDANHSSVELGIRLQEFAESLNGDIAATRHRDVRMPGAKLRFDADGQRGFLHALVNLEQMRVCFAEADPDNFRRPF